MWVLMCNLEVFKPKNRTEMYPCWIFTLTTPEDSQFSDKSMGFLPGLWSLQQCPIHQMAVRVAHPSQSVSGKLQAPNTDQSPNPWYRQLARLRPKLFPCKFLPLLLVSTPEHSSDCYRNPFTESLNPRQLSNWASCCHSLPLTPLQCGTFLTKIKRKLNLW